MDRETTKSLKKQRLLDKGVAMLMDRGYHGTGLKDILDAVKVPKGSFYNYFDSKEAFGAEVIQHYIDPFIIQVESHLERSDQNALSGLLNYFSELIAELETQHFAGGCLLGNLMGEIGDTSEICRKSLLVAVQRYRDVLRKGLESAIKQGSLESDLSAVEMADLLVDGWQGALLRMKIEQSSEPLRRFCDQTLGRWNKRS